MSTTPSGSGRISRSARWACGTGPSCAPSRGLWSRSDRRRLRADRLLAVQCPLRLPAPGGSADQRDGRVEPDRAAPPRGVCGRDLIDAACELIDFWRFNVHYAFRLREDQPISAMGVWNRTELRPLEGFVVAI